MSVEKKAANLQAEANILWPVIMRVGWIIQRQLAQGLAGLNLTIPQYMTMAALQRRPDGYSMSELAAVAHQVSATMTGIIDRLVERQLVERRQDPSDRRSWRVYLTDLGAKLLEQANRQKHDRLIGVLREMRPEDRQEMLRLLNLFLAASGTDLERIHGKESS